VFYNSLINPQNNILGTLSKSILRVVRSNAKWIPLLHRCVKRAGCASCHLLLSLPSFVFSALPHCMGRYTHQL